MSANNVPEKPGAYQLKKAGTVIYVGSADNLLKRYNEWGTNPDNDCVKREGWDNFTWQATVSLKEARALELQWYNAFKPKCNLVTPPGK
ncbi:MAG: GIY-YIG nuclease family protein [Syntrophobacteraceae bacterium]